MWLNVRGPTDKIWINLFPSSFILYSKLRLALVSWCFYRLYI
jgi:hypothetical protein